MNVPFPMGISNLLLSAVILKNLLFLEVLFEFYEAGTVRNDDGNTVVVDFLLEDLNELIMVLGQGNNLADMILFNTKTCTDLPEFAVCAGGLTTGHSSDVVVKNHDNNISLLVYAVQKTSHTAVAEGTVADNSEGGEDTHLACALSHGDGSTHTYGGVDGTHVETESVASDIAEYATFLIVLQYIENSIIAVDVGAALAECGGTVGNNLGDSSTSLNLATESLGYLLCIKLTIAADGLVETAHNFLTLAEEAFNMLLNVRLTIFENEDLFALVIETVDHSIGKRILGNLYDRIGALATREVLHEVVESDTSGDDTEFLVGAFEIFVETAFFAALGEEGLLVDKVSVKTLSVSRKKYEACGIAGSGDGVLGKSCTTLNTCTAVSQTGGDTVKDRGAEFLGEFIAEEYHIVSFLLVAGLEHGDHCPVAVVAAVLFVLRGEHGGVVSNNDDNALGTDDSSIHEGVTTHVKTYVLHAGHSALASISHTDRSFESGLFVCTPVSYDTFFFCFLGFDYKLSNLSGGGARIGVDGTTACVYKCLSDGFVAQEKGF